MKIGINTSLTLLRKRGKVLLSVLNEFETLELRDPAPDLEQAYITDPKCLTLRKAMQKLPPRARSLMEFYYGKEPRLKEAAALLGITEATAKSRMLRAWRMLRHLLEQQNPDSVKDKRVETPQIRTALAHRTISPWRHSTGDDAILRAGLRNHCLKDLFKENTWETIA
jgi:hypothetical protein